MDVANVVAETLELIRGSLPANIHLEASVQQSPQVVIGDATQLHQVVMNLCSNAIHALKVWVDNSEADGHGVLPASFNLRQWVDAFVLRQDIQDLLDLHIRLCTAISLSHITTAHLPML